MATRSSNIDVRLRLMGARTFTAQVAAARGQLEAMGVRGAGALAGFASQSAKLKGIGSSLSRNVTLPLVGVAALGAKTAIDFERSMAQVGVALDVPQKSLGTLNDLAVKMGAETVFSANDAAQAMLELAKGGMTDAQIQGGALRSTMTLAAAGGLELADSATKVSSAMNTFGLKASDSTKIADALAGAANASSADVSDMGLALSQVGQGAVNAGLNINETTGALAAFADNGIKGSDAGTSLKTMLQRLNPQSEKAKSLMRDLGLEFFDAQGNAKSLTGIAAELTDGFGGLTQEQRSAAMQTIFGSDATRAASVIFKEGEAGLAKYIQATKERGAAQKMADAQMRGLPGAWESLKGSLETAALVIGNQLAPTLEAVADVIIKLVNGFTALPDPVQKAAVAFGVAAAAAGPLSYLLGSLAAGAGRLVTWLPPLITALRNFRIMVAMVGWTKALSAAFAFLGVSIRAALMTTGIGAIIVGIVLLQEKFHFLEPTIAAVKVAAVAAFGWIKTAASDLAAWMVGAWNKIKAAGKVVWKVISTAAKIAFDVINVATKPLQVALFVLFNVAKVQAKATFAVVKFVATTAFKAIKFVAVPVFNWLKGAVGMVRGWFEAAFGAVSGVVSAAFGGVKTAVVGALNFIIGAINKVIGAMNSAIGLFNKLPGPDIGQIGTIAEIRTAADTNVENFEAGTGSSPAGDPFGGRTGPRSRAQTTAGQQPGKLGAGDLNPNMDKGAVIENRFYVDGAEVAAKVIDRVERARARQ